MIKLYILFQHLQVYTLNHLIVKAGGHWPFYAAQIGTTVSYKAKCSAFPQVFCYKEHEDEAAAPQKLVSFMSSCRNLDVLPVAAQTAASSPLLLLSAAVTAALLTLGATLGARLLARAATPPRTIYLHYAMADDGYVRAHVSPEVRSTTYIFS